MPHVAGIARRSGVYQFRLATDGEGDPPTLWPPIDTPVSSPGTMVTYGVLSRGRPRFVRGPSIDTSAAERIDPGTPIGYYGPVSRNRPRFVRGPSVYVDVGAIVDIYSLADQVLIGQDAIFAFATADEAQQDVWDIGEPYTIEAQTASLPDNETVDILANWQPNPDFLDAASASFVGAGGTVDTSGEIGGSGVLQGQDATFDVPEDAYQDNRAGGQLEAQSAEMSGTGSVETPPFAVQDVWNVQMGSGYTAKQTMSILLAGIAGTAFGFKPQGQMYEEGDEFGYYGSDGVTKVIRATYTEGNRVVIELNPEG